MICVYYKKYEIKRRQREEKRQTDRGEQKRNREGKGEENSTQNLTSKSSED